MTFDMGKNVLSSKFSDIVHVSIPGKNICPEEQGDTQQLISWCPEQKKHQINSFSWDFAFHFDSFFLQDIHDRCRKLEFNEMDK